MSRICVLSPDLANKIAAGEVVERPASVVKELMENAIDAGATHIRLDVWGAGKEKIIVADNGSGMTPKEAKLSLERHATSKIKKEEDLFEVRTLGFRGEALPSIASVAQMSIETKFAEDHHLYGVALKIEGGIAVETKEVAIPVGTRIAVENLFFNTPARLKFLKSDGVELGHIEDVFVRLALSRFDCSFQYFVGGNLKIDCALSKDPLERLSTILRKNFVADVLQVAQTTPHMSLQGWVLHPRQTAKNGDGVYFYLNGRYLKDRVLQHALMEGYSSFLMKGQYPKAVLYLTMPPENFDVNVHPSKREVRFLKPREVHQFVSQTVGKYLQQKIYQRESPRLGQAAVVDGIPSGKNGIRMGSTPFGSEGIGNFNYWIPDVKIACHDAFPEGIPSTTAPSFSQEVSLFSTKSFFNSLTILGVVDHTYVVCLSPSQELILIDQHAAHERIGYEKLKRRHSASEVQRLLLPVTIELPAQQFETLFSFLDHLQKCGLELEPFGEKTFVVKAIPTFLSETDVKPLLEEIVEELSHTETSQAFQTVVDHLLKTIACHRQVRGGDRLVPEELQYLLKEMDEYQATHCPHGRPTYVILPMDKIKDWFCRT